MLAERYDNELHHGRLNGDGSWNGYSMGDLHRYWKQCLVQFRGKVYRVEQCAMYHTRGYDNTSIPVFRINNFKSITWLVHPEHEDLQLQPPKLGYFNAKNNSYCVFMHRRIDRSFKQGLHFQNVASEIPFYKLMNVFDHRIYDSIAPHSVRGCNNRWLESFLYTNGYNTVYPTFPDAYRLLTESNSLCVALSRDFAIAYHPISGEINLLHDEVIVARVESEDSVAILDEYAWLTDSIEEVLHA